MTPDENELLCLVTGDAPMGQLIRRHWIPACLSEEVAEPVASAVVPVTGVVIPDTGATSGFDNELGDTVAFGSRLATLALNRFTWSIRSRLRSPSLTVCTLSLTADSLFCA